MPVRAKFRCDKIERSMTTVQDPATKQYVQKEAQTIQLNAVAGGSPENRQFWHYTPAGSICLGTVNAEAAKQFELGKEFYVDFTPASPPAGQ